MKKKTKRELSDYLMANYSIKIQQDTLNEGGIKHNADYFEDQIIEYLFEKFKEKFIQELYITHAISPIARQHITKSALNHIHKTMFISLGNGLKKNKDQLVKEEKTSDHKSGDRIYTKRIYVLKLK
jgi:hypothetical protein